MKTISETKPQFNKIVEHYKDELKSIRTGRANVALVSGIMVFAYNTTTPLNQLANITIPDSKTIIVEPWDKSIIKDIEKAITNSASGLSASNEGNFLRIVLPAITEENRKDLLKTINQKSEQARIAVRQIRDDVKEEIVTAERDGDITEDDKYTYIKKLDEMINEYNATIKDLSSEKEKEILTV